MAFVNITSKCDKTDECMCGPCVKADFRKTIISNGLNPTRYGFQPPASEAQVHYWNMLAKTRLSAEEIARKAPETMTKWQISQEITELKTMRQHNRTDAAAKLVEITEGMYWKNGVPVMIQKSQTSGRLYAKMWDAEVETFKYAPGIVNTLTNDDRMTEEQAAGFGSLYGMCCICGHILTDETSKAMGIGPVCGGREFGDDFTTRFKAKKAELVAEARAKAAAEIANK